MVVDPGLPGKQIAEVKSLLPTEMEMDNHLFQLLKIAQFFEELLLG